MFGRTVVCIYDNQRTHKNQPKNTYRKPPNYSNNNSDDEQQPQYNQTTTTTTENQEQTPNDNTKEQKQTTTKTQNQESIDNNRNVTIRKPKQIRQTETFIIEKQLPPYDTNKFPQLNSQQQNTESVYACLKYAVNL